MDWPLRTRPCHQPLASPVVSAPRFFPIWSKRLPQLFVGKNHPLDHGLDFVPRVFTYMPALDFPLEFVDVVPQERANDHASWILKSPCLGCIVILIG